MAGRKKFVLLLIVSALCVCLSVAYIALAAEGGSQEDPLVSLSYLKNVFLPEVLTKVDQKIAAGGQTPGTSGESSGTYKAISLKKGDVLKGHEGTELILRSGEAVAVASGENGLPDITSGVDLLGGKTVEKNHAYIVPRQDGRGIQMATDGFVMVKGAYEVASDADWLG